jgi:hypothetical protein
MSLSGCESCYEIILVCMVTHHMEKGDNGIELSVKPKRSCVTMDKVYIGSRIV